MTRQRARPWRGALVAVGVAAASATLLAVDGGGQIAADLRAARAVDDAPAVEQLIRVNWAGSPPEAGLPALDALANRAAGGLTGGPVARSVLLRETILGGGRGAVLAGADDLTRWVRLDRGRLPGPCRPERCEVIQVLGAPLAVRGTPDARIVRVGTGTLTSVLPFGDLAASRASAGAFAQTPVLVSGDRDGLSGLAGLSFVYRTYSWAGQVDRGLVRPWTIDTLLAREGRAAEVLASGGTAFSLTTPDRAVLEARDASRSASTRMLLVGGAAAALVLGFALLAAVSLRADHAEELARLERRGAGRGLRIAFTLAERLWISFAGVALGAVVAIGAVGLIADRTGTEAGDILRHSILTPAGLALIGSLWLGTSAVLVAAQAPGAGGQRVGGIHVADIVAVAAVVAVALAAARGGASADQLAAGRDDPLLPALPVLVSLTAGLLAARLFGPCLRLAERRLRRGPLRLRLALLALARRPERAALTTAFLVVGLGLGIFAESYRSTLTRGHRDQAAYAVPRDATVAGGAGNRLFAALSGTASDGVDALPVQRSAMSVTGSGSIPIEGTLLGVPAGAIGGLDGWRSDFSDLSPVELADRLGGSTTPSLGGADLPPGVAAVELPAVRTGQPIDLSLAIRTTRGATVSAPLHPSGRAYRGAIPAAARGGRIVALEASPTPEQQVSFGHATAEGRGGDLITGTLRLGPLTARGGEVLTGWRGWIGRGGLQAGADPRGVRVRYSVGGDARPLIRPRQPLDGVELPVIVSPEIAANVRTGARLTFRLASGQVVTGRVAGAARRFPTLGGSFAVADESQLAARLAVDSPGSGLPNEAWLDAKGSDARSLDALLASGAYRGLSVTRRSATQARLQSDPLGRGILITLAGASLVALVLGVVALLLAVLSDLRDERRELADLAAQGVSPGMLRGQLRLRGGVIMTLAVFGGLVLGVALSSLAVRLVLVTAGSGSPVPPLVRVGDWPRVLAGLAAWVAAGGLALVLATRAALGRRVEGARA